MLFFWLKALTIGAFVIFMVYKYYKLEQMEKRMRERERQLDEIQKEVILNFADMIEKRDDCTGKHTKRTSAYVRILGEELKRRGVYDVDDDYIEKISSAAPLHDVGKIGVSDIILNKPGRLTAEEFDTIKVHPLIGKEMLEPVIKGVDEDDYLHYAYDMVLSHHERWDGTGYPNGIAGEDIPLSARIMAVADVFDALISERCYKEAYSYDKAFQIIQDSSGTHFDPLLVEAFLNRKDEIRCAG